MSNKSRKFRRTWTITAEGTSRGPKGEMTFVEKALDDFLSGASTFIGIMSQDTEIIISTSKEGD